MKKSIYIIILLAFLCMMSCGNKSRSTTVNSEEVINETPEALVEDDSYKISSFSSRNSTDIITTLYNEALEKNNELNQLNEAIKNVGSLKNDSITEYEKFYQTNRKYWNTAKRYINQLKDSVLKQATLETFETIELNYKNKFSNYEKTFNDIYQKALSLEDQLILMKLFVTAPMIKNYQTNEKPSIESLEFINAEYDKLIEKTEKFIKTAK